MVVVHVAKVEESEIVQVVATAYKRQRLFVVDKER